MRISLRLGDCLERMAELPEGSVGAIVCDPPYGLSPSPPPKPLNSGKGGAPP